MRSIEAIITDKVVAAITADRDLIVRLHNLAARLARAEETSVDRPDYDAFIAEAKDIDAEIASRTTAKPYTPVSRAA